MFQVFAIYNLYLDFVNDVFDTENLIFHVTVFNSVSTGAFMSYVIYLKTFPLQDYFLILLFFDQLGNYYAVRTEVGIQFYLSPHRAESAPNVLSLLCSRSCR